ncbi:MAG: hypothetical protein AAF927_03500 [Bacteroidota bacterium]
MNHETRIKGLTPKELVEIIESSADYLPEVLAFAEAELKSREIDPSEIEMLTTEVRREQDLKLAKQKAQRAGQEKWKTDLRRFVENKNPLLLVALIFMALIVGLALPSDLGFLRFMFDQAKNWDFLSVAYFFPTLLLISGTIGLFLEKKWAWFLAVPVLSYYASKFAIGVLGMNIAYGNSFLDILFWHNQDYFNFEAFGYMMLNLAPLIILLLPRVIKHLELPKWSLLLPIAGLGLAFYIFGYLLEEPEPIRLDLPLEEQGIMIDSVEAPMQEEIDAAINELFENDTSILENVPDSNK